MGLRNVLRYDNFLTERKQRGELYHYTSFLGLSNILDEKCIGNSGSVSLTRDKNFHRFDRAGVHTNVRITLDGERLTDTYKINPFNFFKHSKCLAHTSTLDALDYHPNIECEELVIRNIENLPKYVLAIDFIPENILFSNLLSLQHIDMELDELIENYIKTTNDWRGTDQATQRPPAPIKELCNWFEKTYQIQSTYGITMGVTTPIKTYFNRTKPKF